MRIPVGTAERGSQRWIQLLVNRAPHLIDGQISEPLSADRVAWLSPLEDDDYAEYRDGTFIERLGVTLEQTPLNAFWPRGGPVWDGLARTDRGQLVLVEAKSHIPESVTSPMGAKSPRSVEMIQSSLAETKAYLRSNTPADWTQIFYQYANRLAHLYLLRVKNQVDAYLVMLYFYNDSEMGGPTSIDEWRGAIEVTKAVMGIRNHRLQRYCVDTFVDVNELGDLQ